MSDLNEQYIGRKAEHTLRLIREVLGTLDTPNMSGVFVQFEAPDSFWQIGDPDHLERALVTLAALQIRRRLDELGITRAKEDSEVDALGQQ